MVEALLLVVLARVVDAREVVVALVLARLVEARDVVAAVLVVLAKKGEA